MFEDLKKEHAAGIGSKERTRLTMFVVGCLMLGVGLVGLQSCPGTSSKPDEAETEAGKTEAAETAPVQIDAARLAELGSVPSEGDERVERLDTYAEDIIRYMRSNVMGDPRPGEPVTPSMLAQRAPLEELGKVFDIQGRVVSRVEQVFENERQRLWSLVIEDDSGAQVVAVKHGLASDSDRGMPTDDSFAMSKQPIYEGQYVLVRGYYIQRRTGTIGKSVLPTPAPVIWGSNWRQVIEPEGRNTPIESLDKVPWNLVRDRFYAETLKWDEPQLYQTLQWARAQGPERIRQMIEKGEIEPTEWDQGTFGQWQKEVDVRDESERTFTEGARGKWFKTSGLISNQVYEGWSTIPANAWGVDDLTVLDVLSDHYGTTNIRSISAFPLNRYPEIKGERKEHVWIYGVYYKNHTFFTRKSRPGEKGPSPLTMPMFIVMHVEPMVYDIDQTDYKVFMWIVAGSILLLGLIFWLVFIRGESKEAQRAEERRIRLRKQRRARGLSLDPTSAGDPPPGDGPPEGGD